MGCLTKTPISNTTCCETGVQLIFSAYNLCCWSNEASALLQLTSLALLQVALSCAFIGLCLKSRNNVIFVWLK